MKIKTHIARGATAAAVATAALIGLAGTASASPTAPYVGSRYSTNSNAVWCVQHQYNYWNQEQGILTQGPVIAEDGLWGPQTESAVKWFQSAHYLLPDGVVGYDTGSRLLIEGEYAYTRPGAPCYNYIPGTF